MLVVLVMLCFDLSGIAMMGSAAFLLVYAAVNAGHLRVLRLTGANAAIIWLSLITCLVMFAILGIYVYQQQPAALVALVLIAATSFAAEWGYRRSTGRRIITLRSGSKAMELQVERRRSSLNAVSGRERRVLPTGLPSDIVVSDDQDV